jgi:hypothetical protein
MLQDIIKPYIAPNISDRRAALLTKIFGKGVLNDILIIMKHKDKSQQVFSGVRVAR